MKKIMMAMVLPLLITACGGEGEESASDIATEVESIVEVEDASADNEESASVADEDTLGAEVENSIASGKFDDAASEAAATGITIDGLAAVKNASCKITSIKGDTTYNGNCGFQALGGASFIVENNGLPFVDGITEFALEADSNTIAGMIARAEDGELVNLGTANRDGACWEAENYEVCAYAK